MKKKFSLILLALMMVLVLATFVACGEDEPPTPSTPTTYTVTIDLQDGSDPTTQTVEAGGTVDFPAVNNTDYKTFKGWYLEPNGKTKWQSSDTVNADVTIYACWNTLTAKLTFNSNYKGSGKAETRNVNKGEPLDMTLFVPERDCYVFDGWYKDSNCTNPLGTDEIITGNMTLFAGWKLDPAHVHDYTHTHYEMSCTKDGYDKYVCKCGDTYTENVVPASGHSFDFTGLDYFSMVYCSNGCESAARKDSLRIYEDEFVYDFDDAKKAEIDGRYQSMLDLLASVERYDQALHAYEKPSVLWDENQEFEAIYNAFYEDLMYLIEQYQYAYVFYCVEENDETTLAYETISEYRTDKVSDFYALYRLIYETKYREYFFDMHEGGWTEEDIEQALTMSDSYGGDEYAEINKRISEIEVEFRDIKNADSDAKVPTLYEEFVSLNNQLAQIAGYENYVEYAYPNVYSRDYSPEDVAVMRGYVKQYLQTVYNSIYSGYRTSSKKSVSADAKPYLDALTEESVFDSKITTDLIKEYFKVMNTDAGNSPIDFYAKADELFMNGNYYTGKYSGAFNYWIPAQETSILYFGPGSYSGAFTFVHEFGHYFNDAYNNGISLSYDLSETHSQADEMMFLSFLEDHLSNEVLREIYDVVYYDNLFNMFAIIMLATAVDEFEYCVYTGTAPDGTPKTYTAKDYDRLFSSIMASYGISGSLNSSYWRYVVIEAPCYYISYAMSALPCVELLAVAETEGFEAAQEKYFKFFTFTEDEANVEIDEVGDTVVKIGYGETLEYIGLDSVFSEDLYTTLNNYFYGLKKDFSYPDAE